MKQLSIGQVRWAECQFSWYQDENLKRSLFQKLSEPTWQAHIIGSQKGHNTQWSF